MNVMSPQDEIRISQTMPIQSCTILLCTFNGELFLDSQLRSLDRQTIPSLNVLVSDDGSTDETLTVLQKWQRSWRKGSFSILNGPRRGFSENFRSLLTRVDEADYVAFCDQDDVWHDDKLQCAMAALDTSPDKASLYASRSILVNSMGVRTGLSPLFPRRPSFANALVQSLAAGNTMVLNRRALRLVKESAYRTHFLMHDWWAYLIVSGAGGYIYYDHVPHIDYRQHNNNALGGALSLSARPRRLMELWGGKYIHWTNSNVAALALCTDLLSDSSIELMEALIAIRGASPIAGLIQLRRSGIHRQTAQGNIALSLAVLLKRL